VWQALAPQAPLAAERDAHAAAAAVLPVVRGRAPWTIALFGAAMLAATLLPAPGVTALPLVAGAWLTCGALAWDGHRGATDER
jgi:hypothetical protein